MLPEWMFEPEVVGCSLDDADRIHAHKKVLARKKMIRNVFDDIHQQFADLDRQFLSGKGMTIELGAGVYPVKETFGDVLATDIVDAPHLDMVLDAEQMAIDSDSVRSFYLQNVFHHIPHPGKFFAELERTLVPGGGAIIIDPSASFLSGLIYPRVFATEGYDKNVESWDTEMDGPMRGANQALTHIIFDRDIAEFRSRFPKLEIVHRDELTSWVRYLLSGGLNFRPLVPTFAAPLVSLLEKSLVPLRSKLALHRVIVIRKSDV